MSAIKLYLFGRKCYLASNHRSAQVYGHIYQKLCLLWEKQTIINHIINLRLIFEIN